jgi:hypothetical protein
MIYLLSFYWIFAALFYFSATYAIAEEEGRNIFVIFLVCLLLGGILFPMYIGNKIQS